MTAISFDEFRDHLARDLRIPAERLTPDAAFHQDLEFDSIQMFELLMSIEDLGVEVPEELLAHLVTVDDAYHCYVTKRAHG